MSVSISNSADKTKKNVRYPYVAVDFDGTLCEDRFPEIGEPREACIEYIKQLAEEGSKIILYTWRENGTRKLLDEAVAFCKKWKIPIFAVNENPENEYPAQYGLTHDQGRKMYADLYIDDKAVKTSYNVLVFQDETSYFFIGTTSKCLFLRPDEKHKRFTDGKVDVSSIDEGFIYALQNVSYIREEKGMIRNNDLIMQFENNYNNHNYRIEFKYGVDTM